MPLRLDVVLEHEAFNDDMQNEFLAAIDVMEGRQRNQWYLNAVAGEDAENLLGQMLVWRDTPQGSDYWRAVHNNVMAFNAGRRPGPLPIPGNRLVRDVPMPPPHVDVAPAPAPARNRREMLELDAALQRIGHIVQAGGSTTKKRKAKTPPVDEIECEEL